MQLQVLATGSDANCYALHAAGATLLLEAGLSTKEIMRQIPSWASVVGCLISHEHMDHAKGVHTLGTLGVTLGMSEGTAKAIGVDGLFAPLKLLEPIQAVRLGPFTILPFEVQHDAAEPLGCLIRYEPTGETILYATDTYYLKYKFPGIHYWIIECNYVDEIVDAQMDAGGITPELRNRLKKSHMSLRRLKDLFAANDLSKSRQIVLIHLSDERSDEDRMVREVQEITGIQAVAASAGQVIELNMAPF